MFSWAFRYKGLWALNQSLLLFFERSLRNLKVEGWIDADFKGGQMNGLRIWDYGFWDLEA
jgi:hypothetical protein